jgi:hypothetical protein
MWASSVARQISQAILQLVPRCLKHVWCYRNHSVPYEELLKVVDFNLVDNVLHITPQRPRRPSYWSTSADPSPSHLSVQVIRNMVAEMWAAPHLVGG